MWLLHMRWFFSFLVRFLIISGDVKQDNITEYTGIVNHTNVTLQSVIKTLGQYRNDGKCGYDSCPKSKPDMLNVHIVPHSHDDVGWVRTIDEYYYGSVQHILNSVVQELLKDVNKRFIYVESAFFFKWWEQQSETLRYEVKKLVNEGRLEFIGGAWSMNDEATTHYQSTVDQFTWGLRRLNDTFGECGRPRIGWQIDPFGHSREFASLLAQMGYDGLFLGRIDYQDKRERLEHRNMEMIWHASDNAGKKADMFTGVLYNNYSPPKGFCFDTICGDDGSYLEHKLDKFIDYIKNQAKTTRTNNVLITMGEDFQYQDASAWYTVLDRLISYINGRKWNELKVNMFYSTPSCYLKSLHESDVSWPSKTDDFFPYASDPHAFWTGYFTSRPTLKRFERVGNHYLQVCKQLSVLAKTKTEKFEENLNNLREVMGVMQHHDAVTGTEKQYVANDYARLLGIGIEKCSENIKESLNQLTAGDVNLKLERVKRFAPKFEFDFTSCENLNISACKVTEKSERFMVTLYNPLAQSTFQYVRVPVDDGGYEVLDYKEGPMKSQLVLIPHEVQALSYRISKAKRELVFLASELPPLGYKSYFIQKKSAARVAKMTRSVDEFKISNEKFESDTEPRNQVPITIGNRYMNLTFDENGLLASAATEEVQMKVRQNFYIYNGFGGNNFYSADRSSGAYIFRPIGRVYETASKADVRVIRGDLVDEVHQNFNEWISQVVRIYKNENYAEFQWLVGEIPVEDGIGREIITRFDTDIASNGIFFTDSNGREMIKLEEKISGNYYPVTAKIAIEDDTRRFAILTDRAQGGSSLTDGSIELMVHRRLLHDDSFGVDEALNEMAHGKGLIARGSSYFVFGPKKREEKPSTEATERFLQLRILLPTWILFSNISHLSYDDWKKTYTHTFSGQSLSLPQNIHLLTFEPWKAGSILIRFEHILAKGEDDVYSKAVTFDFQDVFRAFDVISIRETTLSANQWLDEAKRLKFSKDNEVFSARQYSEPSDRVKYRREVNQNLTITLQPMEIRSFIAELK